MTLSSWRLRKGWEPLDFAAAGCDLGEMFGARRSHGAAAAGSPSHPQGCERNPDIAAIARVCKNTDGPVQAGS